MTLTGSVFSRGKTIFERNFEATFLNPAVFLLWLLFSQIKPKDGFLEQYCRYKFGTQKFPASLEFCPPLWMKFFFRLIPLYVLQPIRTGISPEPARGLDPRRWPKGSRPLGTRMVNTQNNGVAERALLFVCCIISRFPLRSIFREKYADKADSEDLSRVFYR